MASKRSYHHGNLRQALIDTALELVREVGPQQLSLREVARRLGVSSGAPYRHFASRRALLTAVAEEATARLGVGMRKAAAAHPQGSLRQVEALGRAYLEWAERSPMHFRVVSGRDQIDYAASPGMDRLNKELRSLAVQALAGAQQQGEALACNADDLAVLARATVYGLARMQHDGHFVQWGPGTDRGWERAHELLALFVSLLRARAGVPPIAAGCSPP